MAMATFIVTAPKRGRYDTTTTFSVSGTNVQSSAEIVDLLLRTGDASEVVLNETRLVFSRGELHSEEGQRERERERERDWGGGGGGKRDVRVERERERERERLGRWRGGKREM